MVTKLIEDKRFYIYIYLDPRKPGIFTYEKYSFEFEPFYVGKGSSEQYMSHIKNAINKTDIKNGTNCYRYNKIRRIKEVTGQNPLVLKLKVHMPETNSLLLERKIIKMVGRLGTGKGPLVNHTDGGEGLSYIPKKSTVNLRKYSISLDGFIERFGKVEGIKRYNEKNRKIGFYNTLEGYIERYGIIEGTKLYNKKIERQSKTHKGENHYLNKCSDRKREKIIDKTRGTNNYVNRLNPKARNAWLDKNRRGDNNYLNKMGNKEKEKWLDKNRRDKNSPMYGKKRPYICTNIDTKEKFCVEDLETFCRNKNLSSRQMRKVSCEEIKQGHHRRWICERDKWSKYSKWN